MRNNISIIGSSNIVLSHILALKKVNFNIIAIYTTRKQTKKIRLIAKKFKIKKFFNDFQLFLQFSTFHKSNFLLAPRICDNEKFLDSLLDLKYKPKIFSEKPLFLNKNNFTKYLRFKNRIFIGYNRCFYKGINTLKKENISNSFFIVKCPELSQERIFSNTCHIVSILFFLFKHLKILTKIKTRKFISLNLLADRNNYISMIIYFKAIDNFSIEIINNKFKYKISPIENLTFYNNLTKRNNQYFLKTRHTINENLKYKPGFIMQAIEFKKFCLNEKIIFNNVQFAKKVITLCNKITS
jgi:hypothetical protein